MKICLVISVYKNIKDLAIVLQSVKHQSFTFFDVIISEDGENSDMKKFISSQTLVQNIQHFTQPDEGWRKNKALNQVIRNTDYEWYVFIDGDCVLHRRFMEYHMKLAASKRILAGKRVKLGPLYSEILRNNSNDLSIWQRNYTKNYFKIGADGGKFIEEGIFLPSLHVVRKMHQLKGCNMSFSREAIVSINGFDEDFILPAIGEDIDLLWRFRSTGFEIYSIRNAAVQYHLFHHENWSDQSDNINKMENKIRNNQFYCKNGLKKYE